MANSLSHRGHTVSVVDSLHLVTTLASPPTVILAYLPAPLTTALTAVRRLRALFPAAPLLVTSPVDSARDAIAAAHAGVCDFVDLRESAHMLESTLVRACASEDTASLHVAKALRVIAREHGNQQLSLKFVAGDLGISAPYLCRLLKRHTGSSFREHVIKQRDVRIKSLLAEHERSIKEIALLSGFGSTAALDRTFRRHNGCSPQQYRRRLGPIAES